MRSLPLPSLAGLLLVGIAAACHRWPPPPVRDINALGGGCAAGPPVSDTTPVVWTWPDGARQGAEAGPPLDSVTALLAGEYDVLFVTTEGLPTTRAERWTLWLARATHGGLTGRVAGYRHPAGDALRVRYTAPRNTLHLRLGPGESVADGGGTWFRVSQASAWGFGGRWVGFETAIPLVRRAGVEVLEPRAGYFCAMRRTQPAA